MKTITLTSILFFLAGICSLPGAEDVYYTSKKQFRLPCTVIAGPGGLKEIEIWVTGNGGGKWTKGAVRKTGQAGLVFAVKTDGTYGFRTVAVGKNELKEKEPESGDAPDLVYIVDTQKPSVEILSSKPSHVLDPGEPVRLQWVAADENIDKGTCIVSYSLDGGETWKTMAQGELKGIRTFNEPAVINHILFRVYAADKAGNEQTSIQAFFLGTPVPGVQSSKPIPPDPSEATEITFTEEDSPEGKTGMKPVKSEPEKPAETEKPVTVTADEAVTEQAVTLVDSDGGFTNKVITIERTAVPDVSSEPSDPDVREENIIFLDRDPEPVKLNKPVPVKKEEKPAEITKPSAAVRVEDAVDGKAVRDCDYAIEKEVFGDYSGAQNYYLRSLKREPKYYRARKGLAELYLRYEKYPQARREFESLLKINPDSRELRVSYALCLFKSGAILQAEKEFKKVLLMDPGNIDSMWYLSKLYKDNGKLKDAFYMWVQIRKRGPENNKWYAFAKNYISIYQSKVMR